MESDPSLTKMSEIRVREIRKVWYKNWRTGEYEEVDAIGNYRICRYPECNNKIGSKSNGYCSISCSHKHRRLKKRGGVRMETEKKIDAGTRMLVCDECGFELPDLRRLEFNKHQSEELHYGFSTYETEDIVKIEEVKSENIKSEEE